MTLLSPTDIDPHARRLLVDEAEWRDRLNQLADMRRVLSNNPIAGGAAVVVALVDEHGNPAASR
jgi:hypothetical protein